MIARIPRCRCKSERCRPFGRLEECSPNGRSEHPLRLQESFSHFRDIGIPRVHQVLTRKSSPPQRNVYQLSLARGDRDVRDATIFAIGEKREVSRLEIIQRARVSSGLRLLPSIPRQLNTVEPEDRLNEARAIRAPRSDATPQVRRSLEEHVR